MAGYSLLGILFVMFIAGATRAIQAPNQYLRCYNRSMDKVLCESSSQIIISAAYYGDNGAVIKCKDSTIPSNLCKASIGSVNSAYYEEIRRKCNGRRSCSNLKAGKMATHCNSLFNPKSDYVLLEYTCELGNISPPGGGSNATEGIPGEVSTEAPPVTIGMTDLKPGAQEGGKNIGLKVSLPVIFVLLGLAVVLVVLIVLRKRRKAAKSPPDRITEQPASAEGTPGQHIQSTTYNNVTYENAETLPIRGNNNPDSKYLYDKAATVRISQLSPSAADTLPASGSDTSTSQPSGAEDLPSYVDMTFQSGGGSKVKAWFKNHSFKKVSRKKATAPPAELEQGTGSSQPEVIYSEANPPDGVGDQGVGSSVYSLERMRRVCSDSSSRASSASENHYAVSPVIANPRAENEYIAMNDSVGSSGASGRPVSVFSGESGQYSEIMEATRLQDMDGVYSTPRNSSKMTPQSSPPNTYDVPQSPRPVICDDVVYENVATTGQSVARKARGGSKPSMTSDVVIVENSTYA